MIHIIFGALAPPLCEQLGVEAKNVKILQGHADAITRLSVVGLMTGAEVHRARTRLIKMLARVAPSPSPAKEPRRHDP
jgi:hypothetical protein